MRPKKSAGFSKRKNDKLFASDCICFFFFLLKKKFSSESFFVFMWSQESSYESIDDAIDTELMNKKRIFSKKRK